MSKSVELEDLPFDIRVMPFEDGFEYDIRFADGEVVEAYCGFASEEEAEKALNHAVALRIRYQQEWLTAQERKDEWERS